MLCTNNILFTILLIEFSFSFQALIVRLAFSIVLGKLENMFKVIINTVRDFKFLSIETDIQICTYIYTSFREACYYLSPSGDSNLVSGIDAAVACGLMADGARLAVTFSNSEFCAVKNAIGFQENEDGTGRLWMGNFLFH